ncbi:hypothetical protein GCM10010387_29170 [Streptomyces inusitatus]|uniref:Uncharacterized protein n=1 Tax=Streptomyces inusitatus TaxID=68221 RepID=A0A918Q6A5_9ACTN|nr:hypothetical protein [Streptomyces inusitatus]GGZ33206.1 hypothetical protein GCM10010387_29170 [Streptomyces inusitatus]
MLSTSQLPESHPHEFTQAGPRGTAKQPDFRLRDFRGSKITNDLDNHENPVEVSANARHHSPGYTMSKYGRRRSEGAKKLAASSANRINLGSPA